MAEEKHPCEGKDCRNCETCIFDEDLFGERNNLNDKNKMKENITLCNECVHLVKDYSACDGEDFGQFDARCSLETFPHIGGCHERLIDCNVTLKNNISKPSWCPLAKKETTKQESNTQLDTNSYYNKRDKLKRIRKHIEWDDIKEGTLYVIPRIMYQPKKIIKVVTKTPFCCSCKEINDEGKESSFNVVFYPSDIEAVLINKLHNF